jgi:hypothetical protein
LLPQAAQIQWERTGEALLCATQHRLHRPAA